MEQLIHYVLREIGVIKEAPLIFAIAILVLAGLVWGALGRNKRIAPST
jgi:hypothetical protein